MYPHTAYFTVISVKGGFYLIREQNDENGATQTKVLTAAPVSFDEAVDALKTEQRRYWQDRADCLIDYDAEFIVDYTQNFL